MSDEITVKLQVSTVGASEPLERVGEPAIKSRHADLRVAAAKIMFEHRSVTDMDTVRRVAAFLIEGL